MADLRFSKQISESFLIEADFSLVMATTETVNLSSSSITAVDGTGAPDTTVLDQTAKAIASSGKGLVIRVKAGTVAKSSYKITFLLVTSLGNTWELDVVMSVTDL